MNCPHCGCSIEKPGGKPRSWQQLKRYFAMVRSAFSHWPETADRQFASEEELRKFLQMSAGWRDVGARIPLIGLNVERAKMLAEAAIRASGSYAMPVVHKGELIVWVPRSIAFHSMGPAEFGQLSDAVAAVIRQETGMDPDQMLKETESAA